MAATHSKLGELHERIAEVLIEAMDGDELPGWTEVNEQTDEVIHHPPKRLPPSAALIAAGITFLKNNSITSAPSQDNKLGELEAKLKAKREKKVTQQDMRQAREDMGFMSGLPN